MCCCRWSRQGREVGRGGSGRGVLLNADRRRLHSIDSSHSLLLLSRVQLLVSWSDCLSKLYSRFPALDTSRLVKFDASKSYYAREMYSLVPSPYGEHGKYGGEPMSDQAFKRVRVALQPNVPPLNEQRTKLILIDRSDTSGHRACKNHEELKARLEMEYGEFLDVVSFRGSDKSQEEVSLGWQTKEIGENKRERGHNKRERGHNNIDSYDNLTPFACHRRCSSSLCCHPHAERSAIPKSQGRCRASWRCPYEHDVRSRGHLHCGDWVLG